ncbi:hypothetical protein NPIL_386991 [Nephila pilipes]|uniref:Uncharacterized protein n=1 Tax=Nephila pilipes TaxID=299642 RepID=A0A8X6UAM7_NEPPI|nr:hypothetical protein NPIL_386991 [Nephila pilipes]
MEILVAYATGLSVLFKNKLLQVRGLEPSLFSLMLSVLENNPARKQSENEIWKLRMDHVTCLWHVPFYFGRGCHFFFTQSPFSNEIHPNNLKRKYPVGFETPFCQREEKKGGRDHLERKILRNPSIRLSGFGHTNLKPQ